jgi:hypothetical protein
MASSLSDDSAENRTSNDDIADEMAFSATEVRLQFSKSSRFKRDFSGKARE